ncbi:hypothetical protein [Streptococcus halotolerans]|uniref:hypothetical protein n=1 Tax=Streptococcus halotolerans TaxID=1814128 RepID=UPI00078908FE|nr:hypothetical protein [Streptococcus halotolerans]
MKKLSLVGIFVLGLGLIYLMYHLVAPPIVQQKQSLDDATNTESLIAADGSETLSKMTSRQAGIYYYGFPECPWCQELVPVLERVLKEEETTAFAVDIHDKQYSQKDSQTLKSFYQDQVKQENVSVPFLVAINEAGEVRIHVGTVDGHNAKMKKMTRKQKEELTKALRELVIWGSHDDILDS